VNIVADSAIPQIEEALADCGELELLPGREISRRHLADCQCLIVRTLTRVGRELLEGSPVEFVGSATIGTDHVDLEYLRTAGIGFSNAAGCNAEAVSEYVVSGLFALAERRGFDALRRRAGIVGFGNVGRRLKHKFDSLGIDTLLCDPPLAEAGDISESFETLETLLAECDLLSLHTPLTRQGEHATFHLLDGRRLQALAPGSLLVNTARGEVVDNRALLDLLGRREDLVTFIDTWEDEPRVLRELLRQVDLATPHIAGYSVEGRLRGTQAVLDAAAAHFGWTPRWHMSRLLPPPTLLQPSATANPRDFWRQLFAQHLDIWRDDKAFRANAELADDERGKHFDSLRRVYADRLEYARFTLTAASAGRQAGVLRELGFELVN
jgi:erythronate-4-phosphate dehydrogenase